MCRIFFPSGSYRVTRKPCQCPLQRTPFLVHDEAVRISLIRGDLDERPLVRNCAPAGIEVECRDSVDPHLGHVQRSPVRTERDAVGENEPALDRRDAPVRIDAVQASVRGIQDVDVQRTGIEPAVRARLPRRSSSCAPCPPPGCRGMFPSMDWPPAGQTRRGSPRSTRPRRGGRWPGPATAYSPFRSCRPRRTSVVKNGFSVSIHERRPDSGSHIGDSPHWHWQRTRFTAVSIFASKGKRYIAK